MNRLALSISAWLIFLAAAALEVGGDAVIRKGLRGGGWPWIVAGGLSLAAYGIVVNTVKWDFARLIGVYVGAFVLLSVLVGRFVFDERISVATWVGVGLIVLGGLVIQLGNN